MLKLKIVIIKSLLLLLILNSSQALAISGKEIKELITNNRWKKQNIDFEFLQSLCWDPPKLEVSDINIDLSGNIVNENIVDLSGNVTNNNPIAWYESSYYEMG